MGMYTAIHFNSELNVPKDSMVADTLKYMVGDTEELPELLPDHELFKTERWDLMLQCDSYYFDEDTHSTLRWDETSNAYYLCIRSNFKNYDSEIEKFIDWIMPYLAEYKEEGDFLGFYRYEEDEEPTIIKVTKRKKTLFSPLSDISTENEVHQLDILIGELEGYEKSLNFNMAGYTQKLPDGTEHFCCKICGHSPKLLLERLKNIQSAQRKETLNE